MLAGASMLVAYVYHALRVERPLIDLRLLKYRTFEAGIVGGTFFRFGVGASAFLLQRACHREPAEAGADDRDIEDVILHAETIAAWTLRAASTRRRAAEVQTDAGR